MSADYINLLKMFFRNYFTAEPEITQSTPSSYRIDFKSSDMAAIIDEYLKYIRDYFNAMGLDVQVKMMGDALIVEEAERPEIERRREETQQYQDERVEVSMNIRNLRRGSEDLPDWLNDGLSNYFKDKGELLPQITPHITEFLGLPETPALFKDVPERLLENNRFKQFIRRKTKTPSVAGNFSISYDIASDSMVVDILVNGKDTYRFFIQKGVKPLQDQFAEIFKDLFESSLLSYLAPVIERSIEHPIDITVYSPLTKNKAAMELASELKIWDTGIIRIKHGRETSTFVNGERFKKTSQYASPDLEIFTASLSKFLTEKQLPMVDIDEALVRIKCKTRADADKLKYMLTTIESARSQQAGKSLIFHNPQVNLTELFKGLDVQVESLKAIPKKVILDNKTLPVDQQALMVARRVKHNKFLQSVPAYTQTELNKIFKDQGKTGIANLLSSTKTPLGTFHAVSLVKDTSLINYLVLRDAKNNISMTQWPRDQLLLRMFLNKAAETVNFLKWSLGTDIRLEGKRAVYVDASIGLGIYRRQAVIIDGDDAGKVIQFLGKFDEKGIYPDTLWMEK